MDIDFSSLQNIYQTQGLNALQQAWNQMSGQIVPEANPMTGYGGQIPQGAQDAVAYNKLFQAQNSPMEQQRRGQQNALAMDDKNWARQVGYAAYKDLDQGPQPLQNLMGMINSMQQQQPYRNQPPLSFENLFQMLGVQR